MNIFPLIRPTGPFVAPIPPIILECHAKSTPNKPTLESKYKLSALSTNNITQLARPYSHSVPWEIFLCRQPDHATVGSGPLP